MKTATRLRRVIGLFAHPRSATQKTVAPSRLSTVCDIILNSSISIDGCAKSAVRVVYAQHVDAGADVGRKDYDRVICQQSFYPFKRAYAAEHAASAAKAYASLSSDGDVEDSAFAAVSGEAADVSPTA